MTGGGIEAFCRKVINNLGQCFKPDGSVIQLPSVVEVDNAETNYWLPAE